MLSFSNAKINLGLNIVNKRSDGYHDIESVFYPIPWADIIEVLPAAEFSLNTSGLPIPGTLEKNLIYKAYQILKSDGLLLENNVKIHLHKILPMGAGIGGGSSNGAFALKLINQVLELNLDTFTLEKYAEQLGSDCPFFIQNEPKFCFGKGTEFSDIELNLKGKFIILINPDIHISTQEAYSRIRPHKPEMSIMEVINTPLSQWKEVLVNDFEAPIAIKYPSILTIKEKLYDNGAVYASMTGSGSTVYGIFDIEQDLKHLFGTFTYWSGFL
jgi:4-diphosphocytidyl-2-C-methyl-D-erythritol kinase